MTYTQKKLRLDDDGIKRISECVRQAESKTSGEIFVAAAKESARYSFCELIFSVVVSVLIFCILLPFSEHIADFLKDRFWIVPEWYIPAFYGITVFGMIAVIFYFANIPFIDRLIIPSKLQSRCVSRRAVQCFAENGVYKTKENSGILIFISLLERQVRIMADSGINKRISQDLWNLIADELAEGIGKGNCEEAIKTAVEKCGELLAQNFPAQNDNPDELPDNIIFLEDSEWN